MDGAPQVLVCDRDTKFGPKLAAALEGEQGSYSVERMTACLAADITRSPLAVGLAGKVQEKEQVMPTQCTDDDGGSIVVGDAVCVSGWDSGASRPKVKRATAANLTGANAKTILGVCKSVVAGGRVDILVGGEVADVSITGLSTGSGKSGVIVTDYDNATAALQCKLRHLDDSPPRAERFVVGSSDENGTLTIQPRHDSDETGFPKVFNVRAYGARGDGDADDTGAIQRAIAALTATGRGGVLYFPVGTYRVLSTLGPFPSNTTLRGDAAGNGFTDNGSILAFQTVGDGIYGWDPALGNSPARLTIEDLSIKNAIKRWPGGLATPATIATNQLILPRQNNGVIYRASTGGTTGSDEPQWPTTTGATVTDGSVTWTVAGVTGSGINAWSPSSPMTPGRLVMPPVPNAHYYVCTSANFLTTTNLSPSTGATQPVWPTALGASVPDGDVAWTAVNPTWAAGQPVTPGQIVQPSPANGHLYVCVRGGTTVAQPAWGTSFSSPVMMEPPGGTSSVQWVLLGSTATTANVATHGRIQMWHPSRTVPVGEYVLPPRPNGHFYRCTTGGTTAATPPAWSIEADATITDGGVTWQEAGVTGSGLHLALGSFFDVHRIKTPGWVTQMFLEGVEGAEISHVYFAGDNDPSGVPFPCFGSVGVLVGCTFLPLPGTGGTQIAQGTTHTISVHDCIFNGPETGIYDTLDINHRFFNNQCPLPEYGRFGRIGGEGGPVINSVWESNTCGDAAPTTHCAIWIDRISLSTTIRDSYFGCPGHPAIVVESTAVALALENNHFSAGNRTMPVVSGRGYITGSLVGEGNSYPSGVPRFDRELSGTTVSCEPNSLGLSLFGVNVVQPEASLHLAHGAGTENAALLISQHAPPHPLFEQRILTGGQPFKQFVRYRTPVLVSNEPGKVTLLETCFLYVTDAPAIVCTFRIPPVSVVLATFKVVARTDGGLRGAWSARTLLERVGAGNLAAPGGQVDEWSIVSGFPAAGAAGAPIFSIGADGTTLGVQITPSATDTSFWEVELELHTISTFQSVGDVTSAVLSGGNLTINGGRLFSYGADVTTVMIAGLGATELKDSVIIAGGGSVSDATITIPTTLIPGVMVGTSFVRVRANQTTVPVEGVAVT
jgi:hypothetical protein